MGLAVRVDCRRSVAEPQWEPRSVSAADWGLFKDGSNTDLSALTAVAAYQKGDLNGDFVNNLVDFGVFEKAFDAANGAGALAAVMSVPEPTGIALACLCGTSPTIAASIEWEAPTTVVDDSVINLTGELIHAGSWGHAGADTVNVTVGGVVIPFDGENTAGDVISRNNDAADPGTGVNANTTADGANAGAQYFDGNDEFDTVLRSFGSDGVNPKVLTLKGLTPGVEYSIQLFVSDDRGIGKLSLAIFASNSSLSLSFIIPFCATTYHSDEVFAEDRPNLDKTGVVG